MRRLLALMTIGVMLAAAAVAYGKTKSVGMGDNYFFNGTVTIKKGSSVHWHWANTQNLHNVVSRKGVKFHSKTGHSGSFTYTFHKKGRFLILCTKHPSVMRMTVKVT